MRFLVEEADRRGSVISLCNVATHEDAARLHFSKRELEFRHQYCANFPSVVVQVSKMDWIGPLAGVTETRAFMVRRQRHLNALLCVEVKKRFVNDAGKVMNTNLQLRGVPTGDPVANIGLLAEANLDFDGPK